MERKRAKVDQGGNLATADEALEEVWERLGEFEKRIERNERASKCLVERSIKQQEQIEVLQADVLHIGRQATKKVLMLRGRDLPKEDEYGPIETFLDKVCEKYGTYMIKKGIKITKSNIEKDLANTNRIYQSTIPRRC